MSDYCCLNRKLDLFKRVFSHLLWLINNKCKNSTNMLHPKSELFASRIIGLPIYFKTVLNIDTYKIVTRPNLCSFISKVLYSNLYLSFIQKYLRLRLKSSKSASNAAPLLLESFISRLNFMSWAHFQLQYEGRSPCFTQFYISILHIYDYKYISEELSCKKSIQKINYIFLNNVLARIVLVLTIWPSFNVVVTLIIIRVESFVILNQKQQYRLNFRSFTQSFETIVGKLLIFRESHDNLS